MTCLWLGFNRAQKLRKIRTKIIGTRCDSFCSRYAAGGTWLFVVFPGNCLAAEGQTDFCRNIHLFKDVCTWHIRKMTLCFACLHGMTMATLARGWERFVSPNLTGGLLIWIDLTDPTSQCQIWKIDSFWHQKVVEFIPNPRFARAGLQRDAALSWLAWCKIKWRQKVRIDLLEFAMWHHWRSKSLKMVEQISMTMETEVQIIFQA